MVQKLRRTSSVGRLCDGRNDVVDGGVGGGDCGADTAAFGAAAVVRLGEFVWLAHGGIVLEAQPKITLCFEG